MSVLEWAVVALIVSNVVSWCVLLMFIKSSTEKITLLSHVALQFMNEKEVKEVAQAASKPHIANINANEKFMSRGRR